MVGLNVKVKEKKREFYIGQLLEMDGAIYESNNLFIAPTGSGKTHFIMNTLNGKYSGRKLMLVSTTSLKDRFANEERIFTTSELKQSGLSITDNDIHVMTYAEFGRRMFIDNNFINEYSVVYCDEIHSLFDYFAISKSYRLGAAIIALFESYEDITIFYFTATTDKIDKFINVEGKNVYKNVKIFDYENNENIRRNKNAYVTKFSNMDQMETRIEGLINIRLLDRKALIYNERIDGMKRIEKIIESKGMRSITIWSINNKKNPMNEEQLRVRKMLLETGMFPDEYDFVIINGSMREGWDLVDIRVQYMFANSLDITEKIQSRGRIRHDIEIYFERVEGEVETVEARIIARERKLKVVESLLGEELSTEDKNEIALDLGVKREEDGKIIKWQTISKTLLQNGYEIKDLRRRENGKAVRYSIITKKEDNSKSSTSKASQFVAKLEQAGFTKENEEFLNSYMGKGKAVAFSHIISGYKNNVVNGDWSEAKFKEVIYNMAKSKTIFSSKNFVNNGKFKEEEQELLDYIKQNGGV